MQHFKHLVRTKPVVILLDQASVKILVLLSVRFGLLRLPLDCITDNTIPKKYARATFERRKLCLQIGFHKRVTSD